MAGYSEEDLRLLDKTVAIRERLIDQFATRPKLPDDPKEMDSLVKLLDSADKSVFTKAKIKIEEGNQKTNEESKEILRDLLLSLHTNPETTLPTEIIENNIPEYSSSNSLLTEGEIMLGEDLPDVDAYLNQ